MSAWRLLRNFRFQISNFRFKKASDRSEICDLKFEIAAAPPGEPPACGKGSVDPYSVVSIHDKPEADFGDVADRHVHLEELNPKTGQVIQNLHLRWPEGGSR